jgi:hypothetical protein
VVAPTSALTALLYYFGWVRTNVEATRLGLDDSVLGYSTQDYLLRSMSSILAPLVFLLVAVLVGLAVHGVAMSWAHGLRRSGTEGPADRRHRRQLGALVGVVAAAGVAALALGLAGTRIRAPHHWEYVAAPVAVTVGLVLLVYAAGVYRRFLAPHLRAATGALDQYNVVLSGVLVMLLVASLFWNVSHYATIKGLDLATEVEAAVPRQPGVIVYSAKRLYLQAPVVETRLDPENAAYNYAYSGLKLLFRSQGKFFLRPSDTRSRVNIVLPDGLDMRLELFES